MLLIVVIKSSIIALREFSDSLPCSSSRSHYCVNTRLKTNPINDKRKTSIETRILSYNISQTIPDKKTKDMKQINDHLRQAHKHLKDTRLKAHALRHEHLLECQKYSEISDNTTHTQFLKILIVIKKTKRQS